jgi:hypothetical protein
MKKWFVVHPLLLALFPILFLFAHNIKEMPFAETARSIVLVVSFSLLLWSVLGLIVRNLQKAALTTSVFLILFFSYGHILPFMPNLFEEIKYFHYLGFNLFPVLTFLSPRIKEVSFSELIQSIAAVCVFAFLLWLSVNFLTKNRRRATITTIIFLLSIFAYAHLMNYVLDAYSHLPFKEGYLALFVALVFAASTFLVIRTRRNLRILTNYLNLVSILLVAIPGTTIVAYSLASQDYTITKEQINPVHLEESKKYPDIYYIILDGYARADILEEFYQYDNSEFLQGLTQKGFYISPKSRSNYCQTLLSLASSLNLTYLDDLVRQIGSEADDRAPLREMCWNSRVSEFLREHGYLIVAFSSGPGMAMKTADIYVMPRLSLNEFENLLLTTTPISIILGKRTQYDLHRERLLYVFDHLADRTRLNIALFVFCHILVPHPPFVLGKNGEKITPNREFSFDDGVASIGKDKYVEGYRDQLIFINKKIVATINKIISSSPQPPIIILQADHGPASILDWENPDNPGLKERMAIFNAYYLPDGGQEELYKDITPVNTFRIIFNHYFGTDLELLEDKCYFSGWQHPYKFIDVTDKINADGEGL